MNRITPEKRNQLIMVGLITLLVMAGLYFGLIRFQQGKLSELITKRDAAKDKLTQIDDTKRSGGKIEAELAEVSDVLAVKESDMASDDLYAWMVNFIRKFKLPYKVEIRQFNSKGTSDMSLLPKFPYKQFTVTLMGSAHYHELGKFIADFENTYPSSRIMNLELSPEVSQGPEEKEKLTFRMDVVSLVRTSGSH
jgi:Tfp pilus assembly protein PilO